MLHLIYRLFYDPENILRLLRLFRYISVRSIGAAITAFLVCLIVGPRLIRRLKRVGAVDQAWDYGVLDVTAKRGTPTMGGILILIGALGSAVLWCDVSNEFVWLSMLAGLWFGLLGSLDDLLKIRKASGIKGLSRGVKYFAQIMFGVAIAGIYLIPDLSPVPHEFAGSLYIPFVKFPILQLGFWYLFIIVVFTVMSSNSVNITDGMDGLAIVPAVLTALVLGIFAYVLGREDYSAYLHYTYLPGAGELTVLSSALLGAGVGFLWFNAYPASIFMGDTGSLALGGMLGTMAILIKQEVVFLIAGGVFVLEAGSSFIQEYIGLRLLGRRIFYRAPIHFSFLHRGTGESKIAVRFWIIAAVFAALAVATMKLR